MSTIKLAKALLLRKEFTGKVEQLSRIKNDDLFKLRVNRVKVTDNIDDLTMQIPLLTIDQVTHAYDWYAKSLREIDAIIQQTNWTTDIEIPNFVDKGYEALVVERKDTEQK